MCKSSKPKSPPPPPPPPPPQQESRSPSGADPKRRNRSPGGSGGFGTPGSTLLSGPEGAGTASTGSNTLLGM